MPEIAVLGPGGVGGFVAATLARDGNDVVVVAREPTAGLLSQRGIAVRSVALGAEFVARPVIAAELTERAEFLLVATKAGGLQAALRRIGADPGIVVPLLNGIEHLELLRNRFGEHKVAAGVIRIESDRPAPAQIVQTSPSVRVDLAADDRSLQGRLQSLASILRRAGIPARVEAGERQVMWSKLARLNALSLTTSASDHPIGFVRSDPRWRSALEGAVHETVRVANADGASLDPADTLAELDGAHAELGSSMRRDIAAGRETELDALAGAVLRAAARYRLRCPTVAWLTERVAARAGGAVVRG
ncbi:MAG TPA: 2-dehydropantoate 2-reductase [Solirubrobacteraceae bacterium]